MLRIKVMKLQTETEIAAKWQQQLTKPAGYAALNANRDKERERREKVSQQVKSKLNFTAVGQVYI